MIALPSTTPWYFLGGALGLLLVKRLVSRAARGPAEPFAALENENVCDPRLRPGVNAFRARIMSQFGGYDAGILRECSGALSGHTAGRAWDWGVDNANARADVGGALDLLLNNNAEEFRRAGLTYLIFNRSIWNARDQRWQNYTGADPHTSHVHFSFSTPGSNGETSFYR